MVEVIFSDYDRACMRKWRVGAVEDMRSLAEAQERFIVPEWLRRSMWRQFWADEDALFRTTEQSTKSLRQSGPQSAYAACPSSLPRRFAEPRGQAAHFRGDSPHECETVLIFREPLRDGVVSRVGGSAVLLVFLAVLASCVYLVVCMLEH